MSGGFFRGTSADQDTRFSNKQAKLLKSQKFAPELDQLVDMTKVQMDVMRPWIAARATELLGFEDEVLINFIYGLLDNKLVDGKQIQIQLTGFMEKHTGKFMKELWSLLLSAQKNASGVPQQFLDAKEEETKKKKEETDRITQEIQRRKEKEGRELEREKPIRVDRETGFSKPANASDLAFKHSSPRTASAHREEVGEADKTHAFREKNRRTPSASRSSSYSKSKSISENGHKSRSPSVSSGAQRRSVSPIRRQKSPPRRPISPDRRRRSPRRHSISPERRYRSPHRRSISPQRQDQSPRRRSISPRRRHSPPRPRSPVRQRSPYLRRKSPSHLRPRSPSPLRRRSPNARQRSPFSQRRRSPSPYHRRSPSPRRRRSPVRVRRVSPSPIRQRSPNQRKSISPVRRRSPSPLRRRSPSRRSPKHRRSPLYSPARSRSPYPYHSPSNRGHRSLSKERDGRINGIKSKRENEGVDVEYADSRRKVSGSRFQRLPISVRSPQRDLEVQSDFGKKFLASPERSPSLSKSPIHAKKIDPSENRGLSGGPAMHNKKQIPRHDSPETSREEGRTSYAREDARRRADSSKAKHKHSPEDVDRKKFPSNDFGPETYSPARPDVQSPASQNRPVNVKLGKHLEPRRDKVLPEKNIRRLSPSSEEVEYGPGNIGEEKFLQDNRSSKQLSRDLPSLEESRSLQVPKGNSGDAYRVSNQKRPRSRNDEHREIDSEKAFTPKSPKVDQMLQSDAIDSYSDDSDTHRHQTKKMRRQKSYDDDRRVLDDDDAECDQLDDRKDAKRRKKDEKKQRKEERRQRREERHRKKLERRSGKTNEKSMDIEAPPSKIEKNQTDASGGDDDFYVNKDSSDAQETESEQKKLEIELRKKALESLRAKKAISH